MTTKAGKSGLDAQQEIAGVKRLMAAMTKEIDALKKSVRELSHKIAELMRPKRGAGIG